VDGSIDRSIGEHARKRNNEKRRIRGGVNSFGEKRGMREESSSWSFSSLQAEKKEEGCRESNGIKREGREANEKEGIEICS